MLATVAGILAAAPLPVQAQTAPVAPSVAKISFSPASITSGGTSQLTITLANPNAEAATLTAPLVDTLPAGLTVANGGVSGTCTAGAVGAPPSSGGISYAAGANIPGTQGCTITVTVKGASGSGSTYYTDSIPAGALQTNLGNSVRGASGTLTVRATVAVPNLVGLSQTSAANKLQAVGLVLGAVKRGTSSQPFNLIFAQTIKSGTSEPAGTAVGISISNGPGGATNPHAPLTSVPNYVNPAQESVASAIERVCSKLQAPGTPGLTTLQTNLLANCRSIINTYGGGGGSAAGVNNALNAVSGKQTTAQQSTSIKFSSLQFSNLASRLSELRGGASGFSFAGLDTGSPVQSSLGQLVAALQDQSQSQNDGHASPSHLLGGGAGDASNAGEMLSRWGFFVNGSVRSGSQDTTEDETGYDFKSAAVTAGVDYRFNSHLVGGVAFGHANGNTEFTDGSGRVDSRGNTVSLYGSYYRDAFYLDLIGTFGHIKYDELRDTTYTITTGLPSIPSNCVGTTCTIEASGETGARQFAVGGSLGYDFHQAGLIYGPDLALDYTRVDVNGFTENDLNNSGMALSYGGQIGESLLLKAGGHVSYAISTPFAVIAPQLRARYIHEFKDDQRGLLAHYVNDPTVTSSTGPLSNFYVFTDQPDRNYFDWAASITAQFAFGLAAFVDYSALGGYSGLQAHEVSFGIRFQHLVR
jgi:uncharacterized protein YhjY with autotransporter beta-barrel domain